MRISLQLLPKSNSAVVPFNYQYPLSAAIYKILKKASPAYAEFLHDKGYQAASGRLMKLFTFSKLWIPQVRRVTNGLRGGNTPWRLQLASPMHDEFVQNFVLGLFETAEIAIGSQGTHAEFRVQQVEALPLPVLVSKMRFKCLSPIVASTSHDRDDQRKIYYYRPEDKGLSEALRKNLLEKYEIMNGNQKPTIQKPTFLEKVGFSDDFSELHFRLEPHDKPKSKLITIKEGAPEETRIKCFETYFTLEGSPELMQVAWECGLGEHNSQGFGMIDIV